MNLPDDILDKCKRYLVSRGIYRDLDDMSSVMVLSMIEHSDESFYHAYRDVLDKMRHESKFEVEEGLHDGIEIEGLDIDLMIDVANVGEELRLFSEGYGVREIAGIVGLSEGRVSQVLREQIGQLQESYLGYRHKVGRLGHGSSKRWLGRKWVKQCRE